MKPLKIGLMGLYIKLYDDKWPELRPRMDKFYTLLCRELERRQVEVVTTPLCRINPEFREAVQQFEDAQVDAIVTLHLSYSPSLESIDALAATALPLIVLNTTPEYDFGAAQTSEEILYNHGIHGVQDLCNLLARKKKPFFIESGHWAQSDVIERVLSSIEASRIFRNIRKSKVGKFGETFAGMGDFLVPTELLSTAIGIETVRFDLGDRDAFTAVDRQEIEAEMREDLSQYTADTLDPADHYRSTEACLMLRKVIERWNLTAFTINFSNVEQQTAIQSMPFLEASKAMARGIGYAGEGDVLTAAFAGALLPVYPETSFVEMFCPDWKHDSILLSHMGEMNLALAASKPKLTSKPFPFTDAYDPVVAYGRFKGGEAVYANVAPAANGRFKLIVAPIDMLDQQGDASMEETIHGWFRPRMPIQDFLTAYSTHGGTHHGVIVYGAKVDALTRFGRLMQWEPVIMD